MARYRNTSAEPIYFRDDAGKHEIPAGDSFDVVGDQHLPLVESLPGVELATVDELRADATAAGATVPANARKADIVRAIDDAPKPKTDAPKTDASA